MREISVDELYEIYFDTVVRCISRVAGLSREEIAYDLYEEFDAGAQSFLHDVSLTRLSCAGLITGEELAISQEIRRQWFQLTRRSWTFEEIKTQSEWKELFSLCDEVVMSLETHP